MTFTLQVYSGQYLNPMAKQTMAQDQLALRNGQWPIKKIVKERVNARTVSLFVYKKHLSVGRSLFGSERGCVE